MTGRLVRRLALVAIFIAGIGSILATSPPPPPYHFQDVRIAPAWRCPGADVRIEWELSKPAPVTILLGETEQVTSAAGAATLPAEVLDRDGPVARVTLRIEAEDADFPDSYEVTTLGAERSVEGPAFHERRMAFRMNQGGIWHHRIRITGVAAAQVRDLACEGDAVSPNAWEVTPPSGAPFMLRAEDGYAARPEPPLVPGEIWRLRPTGGDCRLPSSGLEPYLSIRLTAVCVGAGGAS